MESETNTELTPSYEFKPQLTNKLKKYGHIKSKVSQYIKDIKENEAEHKKQKQINNYVSNETVLESIILQNEQIIKYLMDERINFEEKFLKEQQKVSELQNQHKNQKVIEVLELEPCECWNQDVFFRTPTISSESKFSSDSTSYKQIQIDLHQYAERIVYEHRPKKYIRLKVGTRVREILTKAICLSPKHSDLQRHFLNYHEKTLFYGKKKRKGNGKVDTLCAEHRSIIAKLDYAIATVQEMANEVRLHSNKLERPKPKQKSKINYKLNC